MIQRFETGKTYFTAFWLKGTKTVYCCDLFRVTGRKKLNDQNSNSSDMGFEGNLYLEIYNSSLITINTIPNTDFSSKASDMKEIMDPNLSYEVKLDEAGIRRLMIQKLLELPYGKLYHFNGNYVMGNNK